jgi:predicted HNH restriction endonuclease
MTKSFGSGSDFYQALRVIEGEGIPFSQLDLLRAHFAADQHTVSWRELALQVGYSSAETVKLHYGKLAHRVADRLQVTKAQAQGFWLHVLADWAGVDSKGHTRFQLRPQVVSALKGIGWLEKTAPPSLLEVDEGMMEGRPELRLVAHRHREALIRRRKIAEALRKSPDGKLRCSIPGCGFCFEDVYGDGARNFIHVHHVELLWRRGRDTCTRLKDLVLVCANCHSMIHYLKPSRRLDHLVRKVHR